MITIDHIQKSIQDATNQISKLPFDIAIRPGLSGKRVRYLLNNICSFPGCKYLNCGVNTGSSMFSAIYHNNMIATGIDWFRSDSNKEVEKTFWRNMSEVINYETETLDRTIEIINQDCFTVDLKKKYNCYFYDADHTFDGQYKALSYFLPFLEDEFIFICDDFDNQTIKEGTNKAITDLKFEVKFRWEGGGCFGDWDPSSETNFWWNGLLVSYLRKIK
jgi:hypothetical protein